MLIFGGLIALHAVISPLITLGAIVHALVNGIPLMKFLYPDTSTYIGFCTVNATAISFLALVSTLLYLIAPFERKLKRFFAHDEAK